MKHRLHKTRSLLLLILLALLLAACRTADSSDTPLAQLPATATATVTAVSEAPSPIPPTDTAAPPQSPTAPPTATPPPAATSRPTTTPTPSPTLPPTQTPAPTETPTITPTATPEPPPLPEWLTLLNRLRQMAGVNVVTDWEPYTIGSRLHSHYMVINDAAIAHSQDPANPHFDPAGDQAARNGNIFATSQLDANYLWSINFWASAPFHLIGMLDPNLNHVGYGDFVEDGGDVAMAAVLDIGSDPGADNGVTYPVLFPGPNSSTWIVRHSLYEWPDPVASCPGYARPTGAPIVLFLGDGRGTPRVESHRLALGDVLLETCLFDETSYRNPDPYAEKVGRTILSHNNAVVIMPRAPLAADATYTAQVTADGQTYTWQFNTIKRPD